MARHVSRNGLTIGGLKKSLDFFQFSVYKYTQHFHIEKKCVLTILKAINRKMINSQCLVPQDMRKGRVSKQLTVMKCTRISSIVTEVNHNGAVCLFIRTNLYLTLMVYHRKIGTFIKKQNTMANWGHLSDSIQLKSALKNIISNFVLIVEANQ